MLTVLVLYAVTAVIFLTLDAIALRVLVKPTFEKSLGDWLHDSPKIAPAAVFYLFYVVALVVLVSWPAYVASDLWRAAWQGALIGAMAYGTYEFTNLSTLTRWSPQMVAVDFTWGTILTSTSTVAGIWITGLIMGPIVAQTG